MKEKIVTYVKANILRISLLVVAIIGGMLILANMGLFDNAQQGRLDEIERNQQLTNQELEIVKARAAQTIQRLEQTNAKLEDEIMERRHQIELLRIENDALYNEIDGYSNILPARPIIK